MVKRASEFDHRQLDVIVLSGGKGTRLQSLVSDRPKTMADINGRPFLDILMSYVASFGFDRFIVCTGYGADYIEEYYSGVDLLYEVVISNEDMPLGTAGAIKNAKGLIKTDNFIVLNGDSFCQVNMDGLVRAHINRSANITMVVATSDGSTDYGSVLIDASDRITGFNEKKSSLNSMINAGVYVMSLDVLDVIPDDTSYSLEYDLFPSNVGKNMFVFRADSKLIDIGTPKRYELAKEYFRETIS